MSDREGAAARWAALRLLDEVLVRGRALDEVLRAHSAALDQADRAFAHLLAATVLRRLGQIDAALQAMMERPLPERAAAALGILRLGAAQLLFIGTPAHAAVDLAVHLAREVAPGFGALVNAVLRRLAREGAAIVAAQDAPRLNTPDWLWQRWAETYGPATAHAIAMAHLTEAPLDLSVRAEPGRWAERLAALVLPWGTLRRAAGGRIASLPGFAEGAWWVQDAAAALPVHLLATAVAGGIAGRSVIDLCAAPGGKSAQLAAAGAAVTAVERAPARLERLRENFARIGLGATLVAADATRWQPERPAEAVLLDAPCSATGTIRRHPDVARRKRAAALPRLCAVQDRLLAAAAAMVAPGGVLVYAVCSIEPEEGSQRVAAFLARGGFARVPVQPSELGGHAELIDGAGDLRTLPCHLPEQGGLDGFYAARLRRR
ncbi:MAG: MFS transporter [Alphaproteobacteria bacterium]|nr:MFS transporter [Alphaproteobacteria bacterium]